MKFEEPVGRKILIVDDEEFMRESLGIILTEEGYEVTTAANGQEALEHLRAGLVPHLILLDWTMPVMNGVEFRRQQSLDPALVAIPVVVFTGSDGGRRAATAGIAAYIRKPVEMGKLLATVRDVCRRQQAG